MKLLRVVLSGSECTGKTTLARGLAVRLDTTWAPEFAREYLERKGAPLTAEDVEPIARGQCAGEDAAAREARDVVVLDTDLVSTVLYARHYYGACPSWIEREARARRGDLYLLNHPDVAWEPDGLQRDRGEERALMHELFVRTLQEFEAPVVDVAGPWPERWRRATEAVDRLTEDSARASGC
jgi:NadR type nicotinamide-nucleotide adenylyltransferase